MIAERCGFKGGLNIDDIQNPRCEKCGFTANSDEFDVSPSAYYDLKCPKCGSIDIDWNYRGYIHNNLDINALEKYIGIRDA